MEPTRLWNKQYLQLFLLELLLQFGAYTGRPVVSSFAVTLGATVAVAGFVAGLNSSVALVMRPVTGTISDLLSKKKLLMIAASLFVISAFGCMVSQSAGMIGIFYALQGFAFAFKSTTVVSLASLVVPSSSIGMAVGWLGLTNTLACAAAPALGSFLEDSFGYPACFAVSAVLFSIAVSIAVRFREPEASKRSARFSDMKLSMLLDAKNAFYKPALLYSAVGGFASVAHGTMVAHLMLMESMGAVQNAALYFLTYSVVALAVRPLSGWASDRLGGTKIIPPMLVVAAMGTGALAFSGSVGTIIFAGVCMGFGQASVFCAVQAEAVRGAPDHEVGRAANTFFIGSDVAMGFSPFLGGIVLQTLGASATFAYCSISSLLALVIFAAVKHFSKRKADASAASDQNGSE